MRDNLKAATAAEIPIVVQYNKRDLPDILSEQELDKHFRFRPDIEAFPSVATEGQGVFEAFVHAAGLLVASKVRQYGLHKGRVQPDEVADGARKKLWEICDQIRRERGEVTTSALPLTKLSIADGQPSPKAPAAPQPQSPPASPAPAAAVASPTGGPPAVPPAAAVPPVAAPTAGAPPSATGEVISDAELDIDFGKQHVSFAAETPAAEEDEQLLDRSVQSNLELVQRYGQLNEHKNLLERKVREMVEVAQNTVHDLNRPVSALRLMLSAVEKGLFGSLPTGCLQAVQNGLLAVQQMDRLIRDLLDSSRLDHDGVTLKFESVDLTLLLAQVINTLRFEIEQTDAHVRLEPLPVVQADEWALSKVFNNLVGNALQYAKEGRGLVVRIWAEERLDEWCISVRDNGIGIPEKDRDRLFRRFERGSNTGGISGNGLGLHIIKEIAQGHGGCVSFDSTEGEGTTFVVHLPKVPVQAPHSPLTETAARADL
jgi:signal transduction histidine kinase